MLWISPSSENKCNSAAFHLLLIEQGSPFAFWLILLACLRTAGQHMHFLLQLQDVYMAHFLLQLENLKASFHFIIAKRVSLAGCRRLCIAKRVVAGCAFVAQACPANFHQMVQVSTQKTFESCAMHQVGPLVCLQTEASSESCHSRPVPDDSQCCSSCPNTASLVTDTHSI